MPEHTEPNSGHAELISRRAALKKIAWGAGAAAAATAYPARSTSKEEIVPAMHAEADRQLLDMVQRETLKYFTDFGHPDSGMARERTNGMKEYGQDVVTTGGTGFGIMAIIAGVERGRESPHKDWPTREKALAQISKIVEFLDTKVPRFHGVFPHFVNGKSGEVYVPPWAPKEDGSDIVETSFLMMGLLTARQYFSSNEPQEIKLRQRIDKLWREVDWKSHTKGGDDHNLYWHWSPNFGFDIGLKICAPSECLVTQVLAASAPDPRHRVSSKIYEQGWLGGAQKREHGCGDGAPLFWHHYSAMGIDPRGLKEKSWQDQTTDYWARSRKHIIADYEYSMKKYGNGDWGLTACDGPPGMGYQARSITNDDKTFPPTGAAASIIYSPAESIAAMRRYASEPGMMGEYGFVDAFNRDVNGKPWYARDEQGRGIHLAIDQGPIVVNIENARSGKLWELFMRVPEVQAGMQRLGFESPHFSRNSQIATGFNSR